MAHKVLSSDMAELINGLRLAQQFSSTPLDDHYRKQMLKAAHILAMDSKNLLDAVNAACQDLATSKIPHSDGIQMAATAAAGPDGATSPPQSGDVSHSQREREESPDYSTPAT